MFRGLVAISLIVGVFHFMRADDTADCIVSTNSGRLRGNCGNPAFDAYTNIPYAKPPLGDLRLEPPQPVDHWDGVRDATGDVGECIQYTPTMGPEMKGEEDCLYLHVYVPKNNNQQAQHKSSLGVIIWLYPGAFQFGGPRNRPDYVMKQGDVILVTLAYRTGPTGFLSLDDPDLPGNLGLKDQRRAIHWVEQNIDKFGGDPKKILLLGDSAGAASVEFHMITGSTNAKAFASLSGSVLNPWAFTTKPKIPAKELGRQVNCTTKMGAQQFKECLKKLTIKQIWDATIRMHKYLGFSAALFRPTVEPEDTPDAFLKCHPRNLIKEAAYIDRPYLMGLVEGEGSYMASNLMQLYPNHTEAIGDLNTRWNELCPILFFYNENKCRREQLRLCTELKNSYMCDRAFNQESYKLLERMFGDEYFHNGVGQASKLHRKAGQRVYRYIADLPTRYNIGNALAMERLNLCFGSVHTADAFNIMPIEIGLPPETRTQQQLDTIGELVKLYTSFLRTGIPIYKGIELPVNINNNNTDQCLIFNYESQHLDTCKFDKISCDNRVNLQC